MNAALELRVLSGLHREARCPAIHGDLVGADPDCDIVLADAGLPARAARLVLGAEGWNLTSGDGEHGPDTSTDTAYNQPLPLGPVWLTVARPEDPWAPPPDTAANGGDGTAHATIPDDDPIGETAVTADAKPDTAPDPQDAPQAAPVIRADPRPNHAVDTAIQPSRGRSWIMTLGLAAAGLAITIALLLAWLLPSTPPTPARADPRMAAEQSLPHIQAALERLGLASRLRAALADGGATAQVSGWVRDAAERDALAAALAQIWPMPAMQVSVEADAVRTARTALDGYSVKYEPRYDGDGRLSILGIAADDTGRTAAIEAVREQLPGMTVMGNTIQLAPAVADALTRELAAAGLSGISLTWDRHHLQTDTSRLDDAQLARFETIVADFNRRFFDVVALPGADRPAADTVPFAILSVVSGKTPFIVLEDGSKLLVGGTYRNYRLTGIEEKRLTFDGPRPAIVLR
ncbi:type III secretion system inner membrane ring subunit SctD [Castellaniella hirudinis]|uniref:Type III secretion system inner membrane ring subunit SctD n=1 Tax=Castellaniella hirudinis TaxID=1144617 RepID=A0ABV8RWJ0_9BURK